MWKDGVCNRQIPWEHMVSMASKAEHLAGSPPTLATVRSKDNSFKKGKLMILIIGEKKNFSLPL